MAGVVVTEAKSTGCWSFLFIILPIHLRGLMLDIMGVDLPIKFIISGMNKYLSCDHFFL